jgi:hypothetical protein
MGVHVHTSLRRSRLKNHVSKVTSQKLPPKHLSSIFTQTKQRRERKASEQSLALQANTMKGLQGAANGNHVAQVAAAAVTTAIAVGIAAGAAAAAVGICAAVAQVDQHTLHILRHAAHAAHAAIHSHAVHRSTTHKPVEEPMVLTPRDSGCPVHPGTPGCNNGFVMIGKASSFK